MQNARRAKRSRFPTTRSKRVIVNLEPDVQKASIEIDGRDARVAELEVEVSKLIKGLEQNKRKRRFAMSRYSSLLDERTTYQEHILKSVL